DARVANVSGAMASAAQAMSPATLLVRMVSSRWYPPPPPYLPRSRARVGRGRSPSAASLQREGRCGRVSPGGEGVQGVVGRFATGTKGEGAPYLFGGAVVFRELLGRGDREELRRRGVVRGLEFLLPGCEARVEPLLNGGRVDTDGITPAHTCVRSIPKRGAWAS